MAGSIKEIAACHDPTKIQVTTLPCTVCNKESTFVLDKQKFWKWQQGTKIQDVFPEMPMDQRETLISGTHGLCFDLLFK